MVVFRNQFVNVDYDAVYNYVLIQGFLFLTVMKGYLLKETYWTNTKRDNF